MRILIIEDEERLAELIKRGLEREGYAADAVFDGETGQKRLELYRDDYDAVILDLMLPQISGLEVCKRVRAEGVITPIIILTARDAVEDKIAALDSGADDYLTKPFSFDELSARIRALLRRPTEVVVPAVLNIRNIALDLNTRKVTRDGTLIPLTLKEYSVLEYLMRNPNVVVSRENLYTHLWDFNDNALSNVVDVHIKNLRRKIDEESRNPFIETIRGVGYRLTA